VNVTKCYVFDLDGTCDEDTPSRHIIKLAQTLGEASPNLDGTTTAIVYMSSRSDECREKIEGWMYRNYLPEGKIYMRKQGDHRPDYKVKSELLDQLLADGFEPIMAFDYRDQVVKMWRDRCIPCAQVAAGDF
jgi:hypothetical protein